MATSPPNLHTMDSRSACIQGVLKVKVEVKGHVIRVLFWILGMSYSVIDGLVVSFQQTCHPYGWAFYTWHNGGHTAGEIDHFTSCAQITRATLLPTEHRNDNVYAYQISMIYKDIFSTEFNLGFEAQS